MQAAKYPGIGLSFTAITCNVSMKACESGCWRPACFSIVSIVMSCICTDPREQHEALVLLQCMLIVALYLAED